MRVQGYGAPATIINIDGWKPVRQQTAQLTPATRAQHQGHGGGPLPGQTVPANMSARPTGDTMDNAPPTRHRGGLRSSYVAVSGSAVRSATRSVRHGIRQRRTGAGAADRRLHHQRRDTGGGIVANGNAIQLQISNNRITGKPGLYNGGIRIGHAGLLGADGQPTNANNLLVNTTTTRSRRTAIRPATSGGGGGISIHTGARGHRAVYNHIAGNYSTGDGGGMAHVGTKANTGSSANATARNC